jgi:hypothetical protein
MLHPVPQLPGPHLYCGPTAICAVTGLHQHDVLAAAHRYMGQPFDSPIVGMTNAELIGTLALLGWRAEQYFVEGSTPTLGRFIKDMLQFDGAVILSLIGHFCTVTYTEYLCNHTDGQIVPLSDCPNRRRKVDCIIEVKKL